MPPMLLTSAEPSWTPQPDDYAVVLTSAGTITLPSTGYRLVSVSLEAGSTPGYLKWLYNGTDIANFPCPSNGTSGTARWGITYPVNGNSINSTLLTFGGGLLRVLLVFSKGSSKGPAMSSYASIVFTTTTTEAASTAFAAEDFPGGENQATWGLAFCTVFDNASVQWPIVGSASSQFLADALPGSIVLAHAPPIQKSTTFAPSYTMPNAATLTVFIGYTPTRG
ncbi:MAG: hypothetical protein ACYDDA_13300 [Acidiferrobacteraceae bacterium]